MRIISAGLPQKCITVPDLTCSGSIRRHVDEDLKPYTCISDTFSDGHPAFPRFAPWLTHMMQHDRRWNQKVFPTSGWICALCDDSSEILTSPETLHRHLVSAHGDMFSPTQLQSIARQSKVERPRPSNECVLCCFTVKEAEESLPKRRKEQSVNEAGSKHSRTSLSMRHPSPQRDIYHGQDVPDDPI